MTTTPSTSGVPIATETVQLAPSYALPIALVLIAIPTVLLQPWVAGILALFGLFLLFQTATLRLLLTVTALDIYRGETLIRRFPYQDWQNWRIFWSNLPILFYFREVKSIHFLPILFDPKMLRACLEQRCPVTR
ncbi:MAG: DUF3119 family protein [Cyanobacteria bacterium CRU_2_1]|nr:DUF3119 family protein [Cyanobacteria bacterium CRU_2_1]